MRRLLMIATFGVAGCAGHPLDCATGLVAWNDCAAGTAGYERRVNAEAGDDARCRSFGAEPGTDAYVNCRTHFAQSRDNNNEALLRTILAHPPVAYVPPAPQIRYEPYNPPKATNCVSNAIGSSVYTNCN